jgi:hypothetical protein
MVMNAESRGIAYFKVLFEQIRGAVNANPSHGSKASAAIL